MNNLKLGILQKETLYLKLGLSVCFLLTLLSLIIIERSPAKGYEISIYSNTPVFVWIFLIASSILAISLIVYKAFNGNFVGNWWILAFLVLIINNFVIMALHALRGYLYYLTDDSWYHLGQMNYIIANGNFSKSNFYPFTHILGSQMSEVTFISTETIGKYLPAFLSVLFLMVFIYLLAKEVIIEDEMAILVSAASSVMLFNSVHLLLYPHTFSVLLFSMVFYVYFKLMKNPSWEYSIILLLLLLIMPFIHPSGSLALIFLLSALIPAKLVYNDRFNKKYTLGDASINIPLCSLIVLFMWLSMFGLLASGLHNIVRTTIGYENNNKMIEAFGVISGLSIFEAIEFILKMYLDTIIFALLSLLCCLVIFLNFIKKKDTERSYLLISIIFVLCFIFNYLFYTGVGMQVIGRLLNLPYAILFSPILVCIFISLNFKRTYSINSLFVILLFSFVFVISIFSIYQSPWVFTSGLHSTDMDLSGSLWFKKCQNSGVLNETMGTLSLVATERRYRASIIPEHFDYSIYNRLKDSLNYNCYVLINKHCELMNSYPLLVKARFNIRGGWGFNSEDFRKLEFDTSVSKLYSNGEFKAFLVT